MGFWREETSKQTGPVPAWHRRAHRPSVTLIQVHPQPQRYGHPRWTDMGQTDLGSAHSTVLTVFCLLLTKQGKTPTPQVWSVHYMSKRREMSCKMSWYFFVITFRNVVSGAGGTVTTVPVVCVNIFVITRWYCKKWRVIILIRILSYMCTVPFKSEFWMTEPRDLLSF